MLFSQFDLIPFFQVNEIVTTVDTTATDLLQSNNQRIARLVQNGGVNDIWLRAIAGAAVGRGLLIAAGAGPVAITFKDHGPLTCRSWSAIADIMASDLTIYETLWFPRVSHESR